MSPLQPPQLLADLVARLGIQRLGSAPEYLIVDARVWTVEEQRRVDAAMKALLAALITDLMDTP